MNNLFDIQGKVVVITGGSGILGRRIAQYLSEQGAAVAILDRDPAAGKAQVESMNTKGGDTSFFVSDVMNKNVLEQNKKDILARFGKIDVLLNAAGGNMPGATIPPDQTFLDMEPDAFRQVVDLNLFGTVLPTMVFVPELARQKAGCIVNFASESALRPLTRVVGYGTAKAAVVNFTKYMAAELARKFGTGLRINAIAPGFFITNQNRALLLNADGSHTERAETILAHTPFGRFGEAHEIFGTIHYLISEAAGFVTGTVAVVDGGFDAFSI